MEAFAERYITEDEYWKLEAASAVKHEYFNGHIYAMAGGSNKHAILCTNASIALGSHLRGKKCRTVNSEQRVKIEATGLQTYPDVSVYCPPARFEGNHDEVLLNPVVLVEVLSPSTQEYDRTGKFGHYKQLPSLRDYLLVSQERVYVEHFHHADSGEWLFETFSELNTTITLDSIDCALPLSELYDGLDLPQGLPLRALPEDAVLD